MPPKKPNTRKRTRNRSITPRRQASNRNANALVGANLNMLYNLQAMMQQQRQPEPVLSPVKPVPEPVKEPEIEEQRYFLDPGAVSQHLYCSICQEVFNCPMRAPCGHSYCKACITGWLNTSGRTCPEDRKPLRLSDMHHDFIVENIIDDYSVACPWRALGCSNVGPLHQLKEHRTRCTLNPNNMPKILQDYSKQMLDNANKEMEIKQMSKIKEGASIKSSTFQPAPAAAPSMSIIERMMSEIDNEEDSSSPSISDSARPLTSDPGYDSEEENLPKNNLPDLKMRVYMNSANEDRSKLCTFLETVNKDLSEVVPDSLRQFFTEDNDNDDNESKAKKPKSS